MVSQGMGLVTARFAANVFELALRSSLTLTQVEVKANGLVIGRARVHAPQGLRDGITSDLCFLAASFHSRCQCQHCLGPGRPYACPDPCLVPSPGAEST